MDPIDDLPPANAQRNTDPIVMGSGVEPPPSSYQQPSFFLNTRMIILVLISAIVASTLFLMPRHSYGPQYGDRHIEGR